MHLRFFTWDQSNVYCGINYSYCWSQDPLNSVPEAPWIIKFSSLTGGNKALFLGPVWVPASTCNSSGLLFSWSWAVPHTFAVIIFCWTLEGGPSRDLQSSLSQAPSSLEFSPEDCLPYFPGFVVPCAISERLLDSASFLTTHPTRFSGCFRERISWVPATPSWLEIDVKLHLITVEDNWKEV